jgi:hypothetical protein
LPPNGNHEGGTIVTDATPTAGMPASATTGDEGSLRERALKQLRRKQQFYTNLAAYAIVNLALVGVWYVNGQGGFWPGWVMFGWGIGIAFHAYEVFGPSEPSEEAVQREMDRMR